MRTDHIPGQWKHTTRHMVSSLVVDGFGIKYTRTENLDHLISTPKEEYITSKVWKEKLYCGATLNWDYTNQTYQLPITGYIEAAPYKLHHPKPTRL